MFRLKSLHVQHYKSLADVHLDLSPITLLVGLNGVGKSNIVDAVRFLKDTFTHGLDHAIHERGGIDALRQYAPRRPYIISMRVDFDYELNGGGYNGYYSLKIDSKKGEYHVVEEEGSWFDEFFAFEKDQEEVRTEIKHIRLSRTREGRVIIDNDELRQAVPVDQLAITRISMLSARSPDPLIPLFLSDLRFASIYPNILREPSRPDSDKQLKENCSNWASIIKAMRQRETGKQALQHVMELMRRVMPGLEQVRVTGVGGYLVPQFLVKDHPEASPHYFDPIQLSDGTLRVFALLLSIYQQPAPSFLALEEPEQTVHPGLLGLLAEVFREVSGHTQLLLTTHSPHLLDHFKPEEIRVVTLEDGETKVSAMQMKQVEVVRQRLMSLSEIMVLDGLRPETES